MFGPLGVPGPFGKRKEGKISKKKYFISSIRRGCLFLLNQVEVLGPINFETSSKIEIKINKNKCSVPWVFLVPLEKEKKRKSLRKNIFRVGPAEAPFPLLNPLGASSAELPTDELSAASPAALGPAR